MWCVRFCVAVDRSRKTPKVVTIKDIGTSPYENRYIRKLIDTCAFHIYSPWVKRGEEQNRAALFETAPKAAAKHPNIYVSSAAVTFTFS